MTRHLGDGQESSYVGQKHYRFWEILLSKHSLSFCAPERETNVAFPYKALKIWVKRFAEYLAYEIFHRPDSWQGFLYIYLLSFPRF